MLCPRAEGPWYWEGRCSAGRYSMGRQWDSGTRAWGSLPLWGDHGQAALTSQGCSVNHNPSEAARSVLGHTPLLSATLAGAEVSGAAFLQKTLQ